MLLYKLKYSKTHIQNYYLMFNFFTVLLIHKNSHIIYITYITFINIIKI